MEYISRTAPEPQAILQAWILFKELVGVTSVRTEEDYEQASAIIDSLLDIVGDNEDHPLADVLHYFGDQVERYEDEHFHIPEASPRDTLHFLKAQRVAGQHESL